MSLPSSKSVSGGGGGSSAAVYQQALKVPGMTGAEAPHPFAVAVEGKEAEGLVPEGYGIKYHAYHTLTEGVFLPTGTLLPGGAVYTMSAVLDFPTWIPPGTKIPGGLVTPVTMQKKKKEDDKKNYGPEEVLCRIM